MKRIGLIGAGGINSWCCEFINTLMKDFEVELYVKLFDDDIVEEKNLISYNQNFTPDDLMSPKSKVLGVRYKYDWETIKIDETNLLKLKGFDLIILGVDNNKTRKLLYRHALENNVCLIDLRSQGNVIMYNIVYNTKPEDYTFNDETLEKEGSCQLNVDIENRHIENGNKIIAYFGIMGLLLKFIRGEEFLKKEFKIAY